MIFKKQHIGVFFCLLLLTNPLCASDFGALMFLYIFVPIFFAEFILLLTCIFGENNNSNIKFMIAEFGFNVLVSAWFGICDNKLETFLIMFLPLFVLNLIGFLTAAFKNRKMGSSFSFNYNEMEQVAVNIKAEQELHINEAIDAFAISAVGPKIRLVGLKLKENADPIAAVALLNSLVADQVVELEFDKGPKLDENGSRRAFVYWKQSIIIDKSKHDKIPISPFTKKTLINTYLLNSEFYEVDLTSIISKGWKQTISKYKIDQIK